MEQREIHPDDNIAACAVGEEIMIGLPSGASVRVVSVANLDVLDKMAHLRTLALAVKWTMNEVVAALDDLTLFHDQEAADKLLPLLQRCADICATTKYSVPINILT